MPKGIKNLSGSSKTYSSQVVLDNETYVIQSGELSGFQSDSGLISDINDVNSNIFMVETDSGSTFNGTQAVSFLMEVRGLKTPDGREMHAVNRIPSGYTVYPAGSGSDIINGAYQGGSLMKMNQASPDCTFQFKEPWYAIGGRAYFEDCDMDDLIQAWLVAPPTNGINGAGGDFTKFPLGGGVNMFVPTPSGAGDWSLDLTEKMNANLDFTKCVPVKAAKKDGFFDYDHMTDTLTVNAEQKGGFNLFDTQTVMFKFCHDCYAKKGDGRESNLETTGVVGKILLPHWKIKFKFQTSKVNARCSIMMNLAILNNIDNPFAPI